MICRSGFPGLYCPASLKPEYLGAAVGADEGFPGLYCPGLMKLVPAEFAIGLGGPRFRGSIAPASLKRR